MLCGLEHSYSDRNAMTGLGESNAALWLSRAGKIEVLHVCSAGIFALSRLRSMCRKKIGIFYLTNAFHVAVHLSSNRSQMTSKCGKNKKVAHEAIAECVTDVLTTFWHSLWSITGQMHGNLESICFI